LEKRWVVVKQTPREVDGFLNHLFNKNIYAFKLILLKKDVPCSSLTILLHPSVEKGLLVVIVHNCPSISDFPTPLRKILSAARFFPPCTSYFSSIFY